MAQMGAARSSLRGCYNGLARDGGLHNLISIGAAADRDDGRGVNGSSIVKIARARRERA